LYIELLTRTGADHRELALGADVLDRDPSQDTEGRSSVGVEGHKHGADSTVEGTTSIEAEPTKPDKYGSNEHERGVVWLVVDFVALW
jgi:hypothetical protein